MCWRALSSRSIDNNDLAGSLTWLAWRGASAWWYRCLGGRGDDGGCGGLKCDIARSKSCIYVEDRLGGRSGLDTNLLTRRWWMPLATWSRVLWRWRWSLIDIHPPLGAVDGASHCSRAKVGCCSRACWCWRHRRSQRGVRRHWLRITAFHDHGQGCGRAYSRRLCRGCWCCSSVVQGVHQLGRPGYQPVGFAPRARFMLMMTLVSRAADLRVVVVVWLPTRCSL